MSIQDDILEVTVVGCNNLTDTEWLTKQDPYVILEYGGTRYRTRTDTDGGRNPRFNEKYSFKVIQGLPEINISVWNSNTLSIDDFIGSGKILLQRVLSEGYQDSTWTISSRHGRTSGEVRVIMHYKKHKPTSSPNTSTSYNYVPPYSYPQTYPQTYPPSIYNTTYPPPPPPPPTPTPTPYPYPYNYHPGYPPYPNSAPYPPTTYPSAPYYNSPYSGPY